jgi:hypothetical protein
LLATQLTIQTRKEQAIHFKLVSSLAFFFGSENGAEMFLRRSVDIKWSTERYIPEEIALRNLKFSK